MAEEPPLAEWIESEEERELFEKELLETAESLPQEEREKLLQKFPSVKATIETSSPEIEVEVFTPEDRKLVGQFDVLPSEEQEKLIKKYPHLRPSEKPEEPLKITPLTDEERRLLKEIQKDIPPDVKAKLAELRKWKIAVEKAKEERELLSKRLTIEKPLEVSSEKTFYGTRVNLRKCYVHLTYRRDATGKVVPIETSTPCYSIARDFHNFELDCINKLKEYNALTMRRFDKTTGTVTKESITPIKSQILSLFICTPDQGFTTSMIAELLKLDPDYVRRILDELSKEKVEIGKRTIEKRLDSKTEKVEEPIIAPIIDSPSVTQHLIPELRSMPEHLRIRPIPKVNVETKELLGEKRYVMSDGIRRHYSQADVDELITRLVKWWERIPIKL